MSKRDQLEIMLQQLFYSYSTIRDKESRKQVAIKQVCALTALFFFFGLLLIKLAYGPPIDAKNSWLGIRLNPYVPAAAFVIWSGFMGGFTSVLVRLVNIPTRNDETTLVADIETAVKTVYAGPILGAVFAMVLYLAFAASLVTGDIFPTLYSVPNHQKAAANKAVAQSLAATAQPSTPDLTPAGPVTDQASSDEIKQDLLKLMPTDARNFAMLMIWCFIAGYSQTFVPDKLKAITTKK